MEKKSHFWIILVLLGTPLVAGLTAYFLPIYTAGKNSESTFSAMNAEAFTCLAPLVVKVENWGNDGYARFCSLDGRKQGKWQAWQNGFLNIKGQFLEGEEHGDWLILDQDGQLQRTVVYRSGEVLQD